MEFSLNKLKSFSPDRKHFASVEYDGKLKVWDVEDHNLKQEYALNLHMSSSCTAMKWIDFQHIILGTNNGKLALYSLAEGKVSSN